MIVETIWDAFHLEPEVRKENKATFVRIQGIDSLSLAEWIKSKYPLIKVSYTTHACYQFSDDDWIKVEYV